MPSRAQAARSRSRSQQSTIRRLLVVDAVTSWVIPTAAIVLLLIAVLLNALDVLGNAIAAALVVVALLILAAFNAFSAGLKNDHGRPAIPWPALVGAGLAWVAVLYVPFHRRLFPGESLAHVALSERALLPVHGHGSRFDLLVEGHLPIASEQRDRVVHYQMDVVDDQGGAHPIEGELSDRWKTRRLGRRGTAPMHLEHLSTVHVIDDPPESDLHVEHVTLTGDRGGELVATVYRHRALPIAALITGAVLLIAAAFAYDRRTDPDGTPIATLLTAVAAAAAVVFTESGAGHPGIRDLIGAGLVGAIVGVPLAFIAAWVARTVMRSSGRPSRRAV